MRYLILSCLILVLSGCYLGNGPPPEDEFWVQNNQKISDSEQRVCYKKVETLYLTRNERELFHNLQDEFMKDPMKMMDNQEKYNKYKLLLHKISVLSSKCFYDLGYHFAAPFYWCLAGNMDICKMNSGYSYYGLGYVLTPFFFPPKKTDSQ